MTAHNGGPPRAADVDQFFHAVAELSTKLETVAANQTAFKVELRTIVPRLDTMTSEIDKLGERVHANNNIMVKLLDETGCLHQAQVTLERALEMFEVDMKARAIELRRTQASFDHALEILEARVRSMRDELADAAAAAAVSEERSGVISSPNSSGHNG